MTKHDDMMTLRELVAHAAAMLTEEGIDQPSGRVADVPTARTVRYYARHGLLDKPSGHRGRAALYAERHLLQLLAIKRLQARGASLDEVQQRLAGLSEDALRDLSGAPPTSPTDGDEEETADVAQPDFWMRRPAAPTPRIDQAAEAPGAACQAPAIAPLDEDVFLLLTHAARDLDAEDIAAIRAAAQPLLRVLRAKHIVT